MGKVGFETAVHHLPGMPAFLLNLLFSPPTLVSQSLTQEWQAVEPEFNNKTRILEFLKHFCPTSPKKGINVDIRE